MLSCLRVCIYYKWFNFFLKITLCCTCETLVLDTGLELMGALFCSFSAYKLLSLTSGFLILLWQFMVIRMIFFPYIWCVILFLCDFKVFYSFYNFYSEVIIMVFFLILFLFNIQLYIYIYNFGFLYIIYATIFASYLFFSLRLDYSYAKSTYIVLLITKNSNIHLFLSLKLSICLQAYWHSFFFCNFHCAIKSIFCVPYIYNFKNVYLIYFIIFLDCLFFPLLWWHCTLPHWL